jgi:hypothetical protein
MLLRIVVVVAAAAYVAYRGYLTVALVRAQRAGNDRREEVLRARAFRATRWAVALLVLAGLFLVLLAVLSYRR